MRHPNSSAQTSGGKPSPHFANMRRVALLALVAILKLVMIATAAPTDAGSLTAVTMNVAGLPAVLNGNGDGDKKENSIVIGKKFAQYNFDLINVQEVSSSGLVYRH